MLLQIMGIVDVLAAILLTLNYLGFGFSLLFYLSIFIVIKSLLFFDGIVGVIDLIGGLLILWGKILVMIYRRNDNIKQIISNKFS